MGDIISVMLFGKFYTGLLKETANKNRGGNMDEELLSTLFEEYQEPTSPEGGAIRLDI